MNSGFVELAASNKQLSDLINAKLSVLNITTEAVNFASGDLLSDIGTYLVRSFEILSCLSAALANGPHISEYAHQGIDDMAERTDFSDTELLTYMNNKHKSLRQLAAHIGIAAEAAKQDWEQSAKISRTSGPLQTKTFHPVSPTATGSFTDIEEHTILSDHELSSNGQSPGASSTTSMPVISSDQISLNRLVLVSGEKVSSRLPLDSRGKGTYVCPHGLQCKKGGLGSDGTLITFERNSAFRAHIEKHRKSFKCNLPGCKNKQGFARFDQLRRHQETVRHGI